MLVLCVYERSTFDFRVGKQMIQDSVMLKVVRSDLLLTEFNAYVTLKDHKDVRLLTYLTNKNKPIW